MSMRLPDVRALPYILLRHLRLSPWLHWRLVSMVTARFLAGVNGVVDDGQGRILLCYHTYRGKRPWGLPGGWMMPGETPLTTLEREVREETGLRIAAQRLLMIGVSPDHPKLEFVVGGTLLGGDFRPSHEVSAIRWWPWRPGTGSEAGGADAGGPQAGETPPFGSPQQEILRRVAGLAPGEVGWYITPWAPSEGE